ncbi:hypothetical protein FQN60_013504 [Etheostoma spectabile]|uniref:Uncharacterized protein n=1 Tax=Etheostoma spectabile TaxID=54343 RepID=A0A5J5CJ24_9PERO|nr:hypothetical protein FQN60_013504 [Etheostoma spectabile]
MCARILSGFHSAVLAPAAIADRQQCPPALGTALSQPHSREAGGAPGWGKRGGQRYEATHSSEMEKKRLLLVQFNSMDFPLQKHL